MTRRIVLLLALLLLVGCKKADDAGEDRNASALESGGAADGDERSGDETDDAGDGDENEAAVDDADTDGDDAAEDDAEVGDDADSDDVKPAIKSEVTLESKGSKPRRTLTFDLDKVTPRSYITRTDADTIVRVAASPEEQKMIIPRTLQTFELKEVERHDGYITATIESSEARYESRDKDDPLHQMILETMRESDTLGELRFRFDIDAFGNTRNQEILSEGASSEEVRNIVTSQLDQITSGLPTEAVGKGARWTSKNDIDVGGELSLQVVVNYELKSISDKGAVIGLTYSIDDLSDVLVAGHHDNAKVEGGKMTGEGTLKVHFDQIVPEVDQSITLKMTIRDGDQKVDSTLKMRMEIVPED